MRWPLTDATNIEEASFDREIPPSSSHYDAFISYSHAADDTLAPALRNGLHRFATPWRVFRLTNPTRSLRVFQDQASLSANPKLWPTIESALASSDWFILFASTVAADSPWVGKEVDFWCHNKPVERLLIVQTDGEIVWDAGSSDFDWPRTTALPIRLSGVFADEPRWIDARWARTSMHASLRDPRFRDLVAELAAPLRGVPKDELIGEDIRQAKRLALWRNAAIGALNLLLAGAIAAAVVAVRQRNLAEQRLATAQRNESKALAMRATTELEGSGPATTVRIALAALPQNATSGNRPYVAEAESALLHGMQRLRERRRFSEGGSLVDAAALSPDGHVLLTGLQDGTIQLWDVATGKKLRILRGADESKTTTVLHGGSTLSTSDEIDSVRFAAFTADGRNIITADAYATARVWDAASGKERAHLRAHEVVQNVQRNLSAASSPDGRFVVLTVATEGEASVAVLWDVNSDKKSILQHDFGPDDRGGSHDVVFAAFSADGRTLITSSTDGSIRVWDVASAKRLTALRGHTAPLVFAALLADGQRIVTASADSTAALWEMASGRQIAEFRGHQEGIIRAALSPDGQLLVTASKDRTARLWDVATRKERAVLRGHQDEVRSASFSPDGRHIVTTSDDGTARLWETASAKEVAVLRGDSYLSWGVFTPDGRNVLTRGKDVRLWDAATTGEDVRVLKGHEGQVRSVAFSPDGHAVATAGWDDTARLWDLRSPKEPAVLLHPIINVEFAAFSPDSRLVLTLAGDGIARVWDAALPTAPKALRHPDSQVKFAAFKADGRTVLTAGEDKAIREWDLSSSDKMVVHHVEDHRNKDGGIGEYQRPVALSTNGRRLVAHWWDNAEGLWDLASGKIAWTFPEMSTIYRADFSPDGRRLVTIDGSEDGVAQLWDAATGQRLAVLRHEQPMESAAFSPDADTIVTATRDGLVRLWDVESGVELGTVGVHAGVTSVAFRHDGQSVATASQDVRIWPLMPRRQELIDLACARVPWPLLAVQRERFVIPEEWCTPEVSEALRAKLGKNGASATPPPDIPER